MHPLAFSLTRIALLMLLAAAPLAGFSRVLCIGADGHQAVEFVKDGPCHTESCDSATATSTSTATLGLVPSDDCGPCVDIVLDHGATFDQPRFSFQLQVVPFYAPVAVLHRFLAQHHAAVFAQPPPAILASLRGLRSVRLLI